ncbi:hypothetical protein [Methylibium petroleiphilum]|uniref:hypothetical protein n=1 Tax=Methylibium petroleiphilum TaxID=105560 RepID=UPI001AD34D51|nr:hypothetical protein [Methylibium petroleiphilum]MBN9206253.1 hypothetical protein [Methylibium petroleiphilum]
MSQHEVPEAYGVFKPVGHVVISFPSDADLRFAQAALVEAGFHGRDTVRSYTPAAMIEQIDAQLADASPLASLGQELNLVKAHRALAERGYHWLVVRAPSDDQARQVASVARRFNAERAQKYGRLIVEELIEHGDDLPQVAESPARGLDAQTVSGRERDR